MVVLVAEAVHRSTIMVGLPVACVVSPSEGALSIMKALAAAVAIAINQC